MSAEPPEGKFLAAFLLPYPNPPCKTNGQGLVISLDSSACEGGMKMEALPDWIQVAHLVVQVLIFGGLAWLAAGTMRLRRLSGEQLEAFHKPCITVATTPRESAAALLDMDDAVGTLEIPSGGDVELENIGSGPAFNLRYQLKDLDSSGQLSSSYVPFISTGGRSKIPIPTTTLRLQKHYLLVWYESLSGKRYETNVAIDNGTLTDFRFFSR